MDVKPLFFSALALLWLPQPALSADIAPTTGTISPTTDDLEAVALYSQAFRAAKSQQAIIFKKQFQAAEARRQQFTKQLDSYNEHHRSTDTNNITPQQREEDIQHMIQACMKEIHSILQPVTQSDIYVLDQIYEKLPEATQSAMNRPAASFLSDPHDPIKDHAIKSAILTELNAILPSVSLIPPTGWHPKAPQKVQAAMDSLAAAEQDLIAERRNLGMTPIPPSK